MTQNNPIADSRRGAFAILELLALGLSGTAAACSPAATAVDYLPSWNEGAA